jgi:hypothetical protein
MRQILACCGIVGMLFWAGPTWKAANTAAAVVSISGSGTEMAEPRSSLGPLAR